MLLRWGHQERLLQRKSGLGSDLFMHSVSETTFLLERIPGIKVRCVGLEKGGALSSALQLSGLFEVKTNGPQGRRTLQIFL